MKRKWFGVIVTVIASISGFELSVRAFGQDTPTVSTFSVQVQDARAVNEQLRRYIDNLASFLAKAQSDGVCQSLACSTAVAKLASTAATIKLAGPADSILNYNTVVGTSMPAVIAVMDAIVSDNEPLVQSNKLLSESERADAAELFVRYHRARSSHLPTSPFTADQNGEPTAMTPLRMTPRKKNGTGGCLYTAKAVACVAKVGGLSSFAILGCARWVLLPIQALCSGFVLWEAYDKGTQCVTTYCP